MTLKAIADLAGTAASIAETAGKIVTALQRGTVIQVRNASKTTLLLTDHHHESGEFTDAPDNSVPPDHASIYGVKGFGLPEGWIEYGGAGRDLSLRLSWNVPLIGAPAADSHLDRGARDYYVDALSIGLDGIKCEVSDRQTEGDWRHCMNCGSLNHQTGGLDAACIVNGTHDNSVSRHYEVIPGGLTPWRCCSKCECMVTFPGPCAAGGLHDMTAGNSYMVVSLAGAPGQSGWRACGKCGALVIDDSRPCPAGDSHAAIPAPDFTVLH